MCSKDNKKQWTFNEIKLFKELYALFGSKKWKKISKQFKKKGYKRTQLQIRAKWINSLDPNLSNENWTVQQLQKVYSLYDEIGSKWALIKKQIPGRTQNKIKNKFYGNLRIFIRSIEYYFNQKNCKQNNQINKIPPNILNFIYRGEEEFEFFIGEVPNSIRQMGYFIDKVKLNKRIEQNKQKYQKLHQKLIDIFLQMKATQNLKNKYQEGDSDSQDSDEYIVKVYKSRCKPKQYSNLPKTSQTIRIQQKKSSKQVSEVEIQIQSQSWEKIEQKDVWSSVIQIQPKNNNLVIFESQGFQNIPFTANPQFLYYPCFPINWMAKKQEFHILKMFGRQNNWFSQ